MAKLILIADDDDNDAYAIGQTLTKAGIKNSLKVVGDGLDVIAYLKGERQYADRKRFPIPSVLLLDLKMPRIGGFAIMEWLKDRTDLRNGALVVVFTGNSDAGNLRRAYTLGAQSFLTKPCGVHDLRNLVRAYPSFWETDVPKQTLATARKAPGTGV